MKEYKKLIDQKFWIGDDQPSGVTVRELISILHQLPPEIEVNQGMVGGFKVAVFNISAEPFVEIQGDD
jgi:hypothetical protein